MNRLARLAGLGLAAAMMAAAALQPPPPPGEPPAERRREGQEPRVETREQLTARLQARLDRMRADEERLAKALEALAAGKPLEDEAVRAAIETGRGRRGDGRGNGPPGGRPGESARPPGGPPPERVAAFIQEHFPEIHRRIEDLRSSDPSRADRFQEFVARRVRDFMLERDVDLREARMADFRHGIRVFDAAARLGDLVRRGAPEPELNAARSEVRPLLAEQFDLRLKVKQLEVVAMERRLEKLRAEVEGQTTNRDQAVDEGLARIEKFAKEHGDRARDVPPPEPPPHR